MTERDRRQWRLLQQRLASYLAGEIGLRKLNTDVEALLLQIDELDDEARQRYLGEASMFELIIADHADAGTPLTQKDEQNARGSAARLAAMVDEVLRLHAPSSSDGELA